MQIKYSVIITLNGGYRETKFPSKLNYDEHFFKKLVFLAVVLLDSK